MMDLWMDNEIFKLAHAREQYYLSIEDSLLSDLAKQSNILKQKVLENGLDDQFLQGIHLQIKRALNIFSTSLIPFKQIKNVDLQDLRYRLRELKISYPSIYQDFLKAAQQIKSLLGREENPLMTRVLELINCNISCKTAIVTKRNLLEEKYDFLSMVSTNIKDLSFFNDSSFRKTLQTFDKVYFIGSLNLFESYANSCPHAKKTYFISYEIYPNYHKDKGFLGSLKSVSTIYKGIKNEIKPKPLFPEKIILEEETLTVSLIGKQLAESEDWQEHDHDNDTIEPVVAKLITLENDHVLFLQIDSKYKVVDFSTKSKNVISKPFDMLELDDCLLVFHESETEMIASIADTLILKEKAEELRILQRIWKERLKKWIKKDGMNKVCHTLSSQYNLSSSKPHNINYWLKNGTIFPRNMEKLLKSLEFEETSINQITKASKQIMSAHRRAGTLVRQYATKLIKNSDLKDLLSKGYQIFEIPEFPGITFSVERIINISSETFTVHPSKILKVYNQSGLH